jgi:hypothetical protein
MRSRKDLDAKRRHECGGRRIRITASSPRDHMQRGEGMRAALREFLLLVCRGKHSVTLMGR